MAKSLDPAPKTTVVNTQGEPLNVQEAFDTIVDFVVPGTAKLADEDWFSAAKVFNDFPPDKGASCRVEFIFKDNDAKVSFTYDGVRYGELFEGTVLKAGALYSVITSVEQGNTFNIKADQDVIIDKCIMSVMGKQEEPTP